MNAMPLTTISSNLCFGGVQAVYTHDSPETGTPMRFGVFLPPQATVARPVPALYWLSGLTCTEENFIIKAGAQRVAAELGLAIITPDTSPRGLGLAGEDDASSPHDPFNLAEHRGRRHDETVALEQPVMTEEIAHLPARTLAYGYGAERVP